MEEATIEQKLDLEKQLLDLKREYKLIFGKVDIAKKEYNSIVEINKEKERLIQNNKEYLKEVLESISIAKQQWANEKEEEWQKVNVKISEAENVIKKKQELNNQEQLLRDIDSKTQEKLVEIRNIEFKVEQDKTALEVEKNKIKEEQKKILESTKLEEKNREKFKEKIIMLLQECQTKL